MNPFQAQVSARLQLPYLQAGQMQKHVTLNEALTRLDALVQAAVASRSVAAQPQDPENGALYLLPESLTGEAWSDFAPGDLARFEAGGWTAGPPPAGMVAYVLDEDALIVLADEGWRAIEGGGGMSETVDRLGVGAPPDEENRFVAKLNTALWTARAENEGGSGDLRYVMSKQGAGDTLSLLFQAGYSARGEIGLIGDDDLCVKVTPDGDAWTEAARFHHDSGAVSLAGIGPLIRPETIAVVEAFAVRPVRKRVLLIDDLIYHGLWDKLDLLYVLAAHTEQAACVNLRTPGAHALTAVNGPVFAPDRGYAGDGAGAWLDAGVALAGLASYALNDASLCAWDLSDVSANAEPIMGSASSTNASIYPRSASGNLGVGANSANINTSIDSSLGLSGWSRTGATAAVVYKNGQLINTSAAASTSIGAGNLCLLRAGSNYSTRRIGAACAGAALNADEHWALHQALKAYLKAVEALA